MGLDIWFKADVRRILAGVLEAAALDREPVDDYRRGFEQAIKATSKAFGLDEQAAGYEVKAERWVSSGDYKNYGRTDG